MTKIYRSLEELPADFGPTVLVIGNFDGVHCGHRAIFAHARERAAAAGLRSLAVTFDPHPLRLLAPARAPRLITPLEERLRLLSACGLDAILVLPFTRSFSELSAEEFAAGVLARQLRAREVHEGDNFRFGHNASSGVTELAALGRGLGFLVHVEPVLRVHGQVASSSRIRELVAAGRVNQARWLLGRPFAIVSRPARGRGLGTRLLVPTLNLAAYAELVPAHGVYTTRTTVGSAEFASVTNVGLRPTVGEPEFAIETHMLGFREIPLDASTPVRICFLRFQREERKWPSAEELRRQIGRDVARARRYFSLAERLAAESSLGCAD